MSAACRTESATCALTPAGIPWKGTPLPARMNAGTPKRLPRSEVAASVGGAGRRRAASGAAPVAGSSESALAMTSSAIAASPTVRAMGPVLSSSQSSGAMPAMLTRPRVG